MKDHIRRLVNKTQGTPDAAPVRRFISVRDLILREAESVNAGNHAPLRYQMSKLLCRFAPVRVCILKVFGPVTMKGLPGLCESSLWCVRHRQSHNKAKSIIDEAFSVALLCSAVDSVWYMCVCVWGGAVNPVQVNTLLLFIQRGMSTLTQSPVYNSVYSQHASLCLLFFLLLC